MILKRSSKYQNAINVYEHLLSNHALEYLHHSGLEGVRAIRISLNGSSRCIDTRLNKFLDFLFPKGNCQNPFKASMLSNQPAPWKRLKATSERERNPGVR